MTDTRLSSLPYKNLRICVICNAQFSVAGPSRDQKTCSVKCGVIARQRTAVGHCEQCGKEMVACPSNLKRFCSLSCSAKNKYARQSSAAPERRVEKLKKTCEVCQKEFEVFPCFERQRSCSKECGSKLRRRPISKICIICGSTYEVTPSSTKKTCSQRCGAYLRTGEGHHRWVKQRTKACLNCNEQFNGATEWRKHSKFCSKNCSTDYSRKFGGPGSLPIGTRKLDGKGYMRIKVGVGKWKLEHVHVVETNIGRILPRGEVVHHRNGNKLDNRFENLQPMTKSNHTSLHLRAEWLGLSMLAQQAALPMMAGEWIHPIEGCEV